MNIKRIGFAILLTAVIGGGGYYLSQKYNPFTYYDDEVHVHADFVIVINDNKLDLSEEKYQSSAKAIRHKNVHLHDGDDHVVHRHAEGITFAEFISSVGFTLTNECLTTDTGEKFCTDANNVLALYVNEVPKTIITDYIPQEEDQVLLYFGTRDNPKLREYKDGITDESCIYSGTCPERGVAPAESCGLTCDI